MAEHVLKKVTLGTHTYDKFVNPEELVSFFRDDMGWFKNNYGRLEAEVRGLIYIPWEGEWMLAGRNQLGTAECNYIFWARKPHS